MDECPFCGIKVDVLIQCGCCLSVGCEVCVGDECPNCEDDSSVDWDRIDEADYIDGST